MNPMTAAEIADQLRELKPFLEAHHCKTDAIDAAIAEIKRLREALECLQERNRTRLRARLQSRSGRRA